MDEKTQKNHGHGRRLMGVEISQPLLEELLTKGASWGGDERKITVVQGLPEGAELVNSFYDGWKQTAVLVYQHPSFADVHRGAQMPLLDIVYNTEYPEE